MTATTRTARDEGSRYEAPRIAERTLIEMPLIGGPVGSVVRSAAFRPELAYEAPAIAERTPIEMPLIGNSSGTLSAEFRPELAYEAPAIAERTPVAQPLVATTGSVPV